MNIARRLFLKMAGGALACVMLRESLRPPPVNILGTGDGWFFLLEDADGGYYAADEIREQGSSYSVHFDQPPPGRYSFVVRHERFGEIVRSDMSSSVCTGDSVHGDFRVDLL